MSEHQKRHSQTLRFCIMCSRRRRGSLTCITQERNFKTKQEQDMFWRSKAVKEPSHEGILCNVCVCVRVCSNTSHCLVILLQPTLSLSFPFPYSPPNNTQTHTHFLLTPAWPLTPLRINMCNSGEILHHHGNQAPCPMERRAANRTVWCLSHLLPSPSSVFCHFLGIWLIVNCCCVVINTLSRSSFCALPPFLICRLWSQSLHYFLRTLYQYRHCLN